MVEIVTIEKAELVRLIDMSVSDALERAKLPIARYVRKGHRLYVQGRLTFNPWIDKNESPQSGAEIVLQEFQFLTGKQDGDGGAETAGMPPQMDMPSEIQQAAAY